MKTTPEADQAVAAIIAVGGRPLFVGGCVRDWFLGVKSKDIDIEVHGPVSVDQVEQALSRVGRVDAVGKSFGVLKFGHEVDVSFPRRDSKTGAGHTGFRVDLGLDLSVEEALSRRDFTMNSIAIDAQTGEVFDPFGGIEDIKAKLIRHTSDAFSDDPLRVLRAVQFAARFDFSIAPDTATLCRTLVGRFNELSVERVWMEWEKIFSKGKSMTAVAEALFDTGWAVHFPEWQRGMSPLTDKVLAVADQLGVGDRRRAGIIVGIHFIDRSIPFRKFMQRIDAPSWLRDAEKLTDDNLLSRHLDVDAQVRLISRRIGPNELRDWLLVHWFHPGSPMWTSAGRQGILEVPQRRLLTGDHLIARGLQPGPQFATLLSQAQDHQDREGWTTEAQAVAWLDNWSMK